MPSPLFTGPSRPALHDFRARREGVTFDAEDGADLVLGSRYADTFLGGTGSDALFGNGGADTLRGGAGLDAVAGGSGSDTFVFAAGDLIASRAGNNGTLGLVDTVLDFQGAGTSGSGDQDVLRLEGFGAGTTLQFRDAVRGLPSLQYYEVVDPTTPGADGFILVSQANGGTRRLTEDDIEVVPPPSRITNVTLGGDDFSANPSLSADGTKVAFQSDATNLVPGETDANDQTDVFLFDAATGATINVTQGGDGRSFGASLSADGATVAFLSSATNLVEGQADDNGSTDVFLFDAATGATVNLTAGGNGVSFEVSLSADGTKVAFLSTATNLVPGETDANGPAVDVFLYDAATGRITNLTAGANGFTEDLVLSADGTTVAFDSRATNLVEGEVDANGDLGDIFVLDVATGRVTNVTQGSDGFSDDPALSADGTVVAFSSNATNLVAGDANGATRDIFLFDAATGETINVTAGGNGASFDASLSADGQTLVFRSTATNLIPGEVDANGDIDDVFVYDVATGDLTNITQGANRFSSNPVISADGETVAFQSTATNLVPGPDANGTLADVFLYDLG